MYDKDASLLYRYVVDNLTFRLKKKLGDRFEDSVLKRLEGLWIKNLEEADTVEDISLWTCKQTGDLEYRIVEADIVQPGTKENEAARDGKDSISTFQFFVDNYDEQYKNLCSGASGIPESTHPSMNKAILSAEYFGPFAEALNREGIKDFSSSELEKIAKGKKRKNTVKKPKRIKKLDKAKNALVYPPENRISGHESEDTSKEKRKGSKVVKMSNSSMDSLSVCQSGLASGTESQNTGKDSARAVKHKKTKKALKKSNSIPQMDGMDDDDEDDLDSDLDELVLKQMKGQKEEKAKNRIVLSNETVDLSNEDFKAAEWPSLENKQVNTIIGIYKLEKRKRGKKVQKKAVKGLEQGLLRKPILFEACIVRIHRRDLLFFGLSLRLE